MTSVLNELADRCEKATGPDRELDAAIFDALGLVPSREDFGVYPFYAFTDSIDAVMTLVPEGWSGELHFGPFGNEVSLTSLNGKFRAGVHTQMCATPALALCAAALRARAESSK